MRYLFLNTRESADPSNIVEPSFSNENQNTEPENNLGNSKNVTTDKNGECKQKEIKKSLKRVY